MKKANFLKLSACFLCVFGVAVASTTPAPKVSKPDNTNLTLYRDGGVVKFEKPMNLEGSSESSTCTVEGVPSSILKETMVASIGDANVSIVDYYFHSASDKGQSLGFSLFGTPANSQTGLRLQYAFKNISWNAWYAFHFSDNYHKVRLNSWLEVKNQTEVDFSNLSLQLIDAQLPFSSDALPGGVVLNLESHTYTLKEVKRLPRQASHYFNWSSSQDVPVSQEYRIFVGGSLLEDMGGKPAKPPLETWVSFMNAKSHGLGVPLPSGVATLFYENELGHVQVLGKTDILHTDSEQEVSVKIPTMSVDGVDSPDTKRLRSVETELIQTEYKKLDKTIEANYRLSIRSKLPVNASEADKKPVTIRVHLDLPPGCEWVVVRENIGHQQNGPHQIYWIVQVSPGTDVDLKYRIRVTR